MVQNMKIIHHMNKLKEKYYMTFLLKVKKVFDKTQHPFMIKVLETLGIQGSYLNVIKDIYTKATANINI